MSIEVNTNPDGQNPSEEDRFKYALHVDGVPLVRGDPTSARVLFFNLSGRNFEGKAQDEYNQWLCHIADFYDTPVPIGAKLEMLSPDGIPGDLEVSNSTEPSMKPGAWGTRDGKPAIVWHRPGVAVAGEASIFEEVRTYADEAERLHAFQRGLGQSPEGPGVQPSLQNSQPDPRPGNYFVTMLRDDGSYLPLLGPLPTHQEALDRVTITQLYAGQLDSRAVWASFGTCRMEPQGHDQIKGVLNSHWPLEYVPGTQLVRRADTALSVQWNAQPGKNQEMGRIVALSDSEVIQDAGRGRHVSWDRKSLQQQDLTVGELVTIREKGAVTRDFQEKDQSLSR